MDQKANADSYQSNINEDEDILMTDDYNLGRFETTELLMGLGQSVRAKSIVTNDEFKPAQESKRLDILLNPNLENFDRFLKSLLEEGQ